MSLREYSGVALRLASIPRITQDVFKEYSRIKGLSQGGLSWGVLKGILRIIMGYHKSSVGGNALRNNYYNFIGEVI